MKQGTPACFDSFAQFVEWHAHARQSSPGESGYCADCLPDYQDRMIRDGRCCHPETRFVWAGTGQNRGIVGIRDLGDRSTRKVIK